MDIFKFDYDHLFGQIMEMHGLTKELNERNVEVSIRIDGAN